MAKSNGVPVSGFDSDADWLMVVDARTFDEWWAEAKTKAPAVCPLCGSGWYEMGEEWGGADSTGAYAEGYDMTLMCDSDDEDGVLSPCEGRWEAELTTKRVRWVVERERAGGGAA